MWLGKGEPTPISRWQDTAFNPYAKLAGYSKPYSNKRELSDYLGFEAKLADVGIRRELSRVHGEYSNGSTAASIDLLGADAEISANLSLTEKGAALKAAGGASAYVGRFTGQTEIAGLGVAADAMLGARIDSKVQAEVNPFNGDVNVGAGVSAFAGAEANVEAKTDLRAIGLEGIGAKGSASALAGVGVVGEAKFGMDDWKLKADVDIGAALGLGFRFGFDIEVDVLTLANDVSDRVN
jgi:hypothetical protein